MLFSKNSINSKDWMDVIFANRNKEYGAYQLRQYSSKATNIAMAVVLVVVGGLCSLSFIDAKSIAQNTSPVIAEKWEEVIIEIEQPIMEEPVVMEKNKSDLVQQVAQDVAAKDLVKFTEINPSSKPSLDDVATASETLDKKVLLGSINMKGVKGGELIPKGVFGTSKKEGGAIGRRIGDEEAKVDANNTFDVVEVMPMPPGGMEAFVKWVGQNYKFSESAIQNEAKGLVQISFVVEKDGNLSSFEVKRDIGFGTGEEAIRLLQKAKKWSPGIQNGIPVRVSYTLPIRLSTISQ